MPTLERIRAMSDEELVEQYDAASQYSTGGLNFWREEIQRRAQEKHDARLADLTHRMYWLTVVIAIATLVNIAVFAAGTVIADVSPTPIPGTPAPVPTQAAPIEQPTPVPIDPGATPLPPPDG